MTFIIYNILNRESLYRFWDVLLSADCACIVFVCMFASVQVAHVCAACAVHVNFKRKRR